MKLILNSEVANLGEAGDVVEVRDGYGRNYLVPQGLAIKWTRGAEKQVADIRRVRSARVEREVEHARELAQRVETLKVTLRTRAGGTGRLFGSVTPADVVAAVKEAGGPDLDRKKVDLDESIRTTGTYKVAVNLHPQVTARLSLTVQGV